MKFRIYTQRCVPRSRMNLHILYNYIVFGKTHLTAGEPLCFRLASSFSSESLHGCYTHTLIKRSSATSRCSYLDTQVAQARQWELIQLNQPGDGKLASLEAALPALVSSRTFSAHLEVKTLKIINILNVKSCYAWDIPTVQRSWHAHSHLKHTSLTYKRMPWHCEFCLVLLPRYKGLACHFISLTWIYVNDNQYVNVTGYNLQLF